MHDHSTTAGDPHPGNLLRVTEGPNTGKLAVLDFGLVAEIPKPDREAMVSAVIHLANKDWDSLIDDFVALGFLPSNCDRALIIPVMDRVLSPYLRGGGAAAFNFQALSQVHSDVKHSATSASSRLAAGLAMWPLLTTPEWQPLRSIACMPVGESFSCVCWPVDVSYSAVAVVMCAKLQDLLSVTLEIPFSVPPYMSLLARGVATLEGIALTGDPGYQMVSQAYPFVVRKVLRNDTRSLAVVLREILFGSDGKLKPTRLSTLLNAALGFVADSQGGFIDFDATPADGASMQEVIAFLLSKVRMQKCHQSIPSVSVGRPHGRHHFTCIVASMGRCSS